MVGCCAVREKSKVKQALAPHKLYLCRRMTWWEFPSYTIQMKLVRRDKRNIKACHKNTSSTLEIDWVNIESKCGNKSLEKLKRKNSGKKNEVVLLLKII